LFITKPYSTSPGIAKRGPGARLQRIGQTACSNSRDCRNKDMNKTGGNSPEGNCSDGIYNS